MEEEKVKFNKKEYDAQYKKSKYDTLTAQLPKGTKELIQSLTNDSVSTFVKKAVLDRIYMIEHNMEIDMFYNN